jgi:glutamyl-tRNA synthetase
MSKRETAEAMKDGYSIFTKDMGSLGYTPEGVNNWVALMGWGISEGDDVMSLAEMVQKFDITRLTPSPAAINFTKLDHFNGEHIRRMAAPDLAARLKPYFTNAGLEVSDDLLLRVIPLIRERLVTLDDCLPFAAWFFRPQVVPDPKDLVAKNLTAAQSAQIAQRIYETLAPLPHITHDLAEPPMRQLVEELGYSPGQVFGILRVAVTGQSVSPPLFESMELLPREVILERVQQAVELLKNA